MTIAATYFPQLAGDLRDCAAKYVIETVGRSLGVKGPGYAEYIMRSTLGSLYIGRHQTDIPIAKAMIYIYQPLLQVARIRLYHLWGPSF